MEYTVVLHPAEEGGYWGEVPALPGCLSQGETLENIKEAITAHIDALREDGQPVAGESGLIISHVRVAA